MEQTSLDGQLQLLQRRIERQERDIERLEERLAAYRIDGWACPQCGRGYVVREGDTIRCTACGYGRYL